MVQKQKKPQWIIGIDEVGRGPLAGPVCVCAAAMPLLAYKKMRWTREGISLTDSKKMTPISREYWHTIAQVLVETKKLRIGVAMRSAVVIDERGLSTCIRSCIKSAISQLKIAPGDCVILLDGGLRAPEIYINQQTVIKGDQKHKIISLAAVIAKVRRDSLMKRLHKAYPEYVWEANKGYGTKVHTEALRRFGPTVYHRKSFITKVF